MTLFGVQKVPLELVINLTKLKYYDEQIDVYHDILIVREK